MASLNKKRSFRVVAAYDSKTNDVTALLKDARFEIDALKGRVCQVGARAGSQLYRTQKCQRKQVRLPMCVSIMLQETTRGSQNKRYGYKVRIVPVKECDQPAGLPFQGTFSSSATKLAITEFDDLSMKKDTGKPVSKPTEKNTPKNTLTSTRKTLRKPVKKSSKKGHVDKIPESGSDDE